VGLPDTVILEVTVTDDDSRRASDIAASVGSEFIDMIRDIERPLGASVSPVHVTVVDEPEAAATPTSPKPARDVGIAALLGLVGGAAFALLRPVLDRTVTDQDEASSLAGVPVIGTVLKDEAVAKKHVVVGNVANRTAEDFRQLRTNLQFLSVDHPPRVIMVCSAVPSEGKTTTVINLARALAEAGRKVTVVEADLRRPMISRYLGLIPGSGLNNILAGSAEPIEVEQTGEEGSFRVIPAGPPPPNPGELLSSQHMRALLEELREQNEFVLIDAPPLLPVADSSGLAVMVDGVLLTVRYGKTTKDQLRQAATTLDRVGARMLGLVLNLVPAKAGVASAYGYGYSYTGTKGKHGKG
jgi:receptor protein-tyrosine kinase